MGNQGWIVFVFLGISAISWVYGKMKEKAEAEEAQKRARLHQQRLERLAEGGDATAPEPQTPAPTSKQQQILARKQQLAQLRQERLAALRAEMAARQQKQQARTAQARQAPSARQQQPKMQRTARPAASPQPSRTVSRPANQPMPSAAKRQRAAKPKSPQGPLANLGTHAPHADQGREHKTVHRLVADAESTSVTRRPTRHHSVGGYTRDDWRQAIILSELLAPPVSLRQES